MKEIQTVMCSMWKIKQEREEKEKGNQRGEKRTRKKVCYKQWSKGKDREKERNMSEEIEKKSIKKIDWILKIKCSKKNGAREMEIK